MYTHKHTNPLLPSMVCHFINTERLRINGTWTNFITNAIVWTRRTRPLFQQQGFQNVHISGVQSYSEQQQKMVYVLTSFPNSRFKLQSSVFFTVHQKSTTQKFQFSSIPMAICNKIMFVELVIEWLRNSSSGRQLQRTEKV